MRIFLSHNKADKAVARLLGAHLVLAGVDPWFDEWEIQAGDSIPGKLNEGLAEFDVFILLWSKNAARSNWVRRELELAIYRVVQLKGRAVPCLLDNTLLPALLQDIRGEDFTKPAQAIPMLVDSLLGFRSRRDRLMAIQEVLNEMEVNWFVSPGCAPVICCPKCGDENTIENWEQWDYERDDRYLGLRCTACDWSDGGEV